LTALDIAWFLYVEAHGKTTDSLTLVRYGACVSTLVWLGEWWRMATAMFLHIGWVHLLWNSYMSWGWCAPVEKALGRWRFLATYLVAGIGGSCVSVLFQHVVSAGASGAGFGIVGARLVLEARASAHRRDFFASRVTRGTLRTTALWFAIGLTAVPMDNFAHAGGLVTGIAAATLLTSRVPPLRSGAFLAIVAWALFVVGRRPWQHAPEPADARFLDLYGQGYMRGQEFPKDLDRAEHLFRLACDTDPAYGCVWLGVMLADRHNPEADAIAQGLYEKGCAAGVGAGCDDAARGFELGEGVPVDPAAALPFWEKGCELGMAMGCVKAGYGHATGRGTAVDRAKAHDFYDKGCRVKDGQSCLGAAMTSDDDEERLGFYQRACDLKVEKACRALGDAGSP
jgi:rhomboid protease GluP